MAIAPTSTYTPTKQEFLNSVLNKIGKQEFSNRAYKNPLSRIMGEFIDGPTDIEEIYVDRAPSNEFDPEGTGVLDRAKPSTFVQYHRETKERAYKCTVHNKQMRKGFLSKNSLGTMANSIITSLHTGKEIDDYTDCIDTLKAFVSAPKGTKDNVITIPTIKDEVTAKQFTKEVKKTIHKMKKWNTKFSDKGSFAEAKDLILFLDSDIDVECDVELLATAFNMSKTEINEMVKIVIPDMSVEVGASAVICHEKCIKINPTYYDIDSIKNTKGKFVNYDLATEKLQSYTTWFPHAIFKESSTMTLNK